MLKFSIISFGTAEAQVSLTSYWITGLQDRGALVSGTTIIGLGEHGSSTVKPFLRGYYEVAPFQGPLEG